MEQISLKYTTKSVEKSVWLGQQLGTQLIKGDIIALIGDLGGGKTWFTKGVAAGVGINPNDVVSPTFTFVNEYYGRCPLFHIDLYRIEDKNNITFLDLENYLSGDGIAIIEWADRCLEKLSDERVQIEFKMIDDNTRELDFLGWHNRSNKIIKALKENVGNCLN